MTVYASPTNQAEAEKPHATKVEFVSLDFPSGVLRCSTWSHTLTWGGYDWLAVGNLGGVSEITEDAMLRPAGVTLTLSGIDTTLANAALVEAYHGRTAIIYEGYISSAGTLVADPEMIFRGIMDVMSVQIGAGVGEINVQCEGELARWQRHRGLLYTNESQQQIYPGDLGLDRIPFIQNKTISWVKKSMFGSIGAAYAGFGAIRRWQLMHGK